MILYIAEKPSLGRAIADVLPKPHSKGDGFIKAANGDVVSWCFGHLLELAEPDQYDPRYKQWRLEDLPILPEQWQMQPKPKTRKQIATIRKLAKEADQLVHAGDPDREGQLLVDELFDYLKLPQYKKQSIKRCLISDLNPAAVKRAIAQLRDNRDFTPLSVSALARSRADWLYGINLTRAYTLQGKNAGYAGVLSVGRVQTPVLGLVVQRDEEIEQFQPKPFYEVVAYLQTAHGEMFQAKWQPSSACEKWQDEEGRVLSRPLAENVAQRIQGKLGLVNKVKQQPKRNAPPLPYSLSALQIDANKRFGLSAQQVLDTCQLLYEKHKLITYPRSDCRYLPEEHFAERNAVLGAIRKHCPELEEHVPALQMQQKSKAWNDKKVEAHHAIIPTAKSANFSGLQSNEQKVYRLIAQQYFMQFMLDYRYSETKVWIEIEGGQFLASAKQEIELGWKRLQKRSDDKQELTLPPLSEGQDLTCTAAEILYKMTQPPKPFTEATLLAAMTGIARYVTDKAIKKVLKETDGLGTEATRAGIIELLFKRNFLKREGKTIRSSDTGRALIKTLPDAAGKPDMTAQWEASLVDISQKQLSYQGFMQPLAQRLQELVVQSRTIDASLLSGLEQQRAKPYRKSAKRRTASGGKTSSRSSGSRTAKTKTAAPKKRGRRKETA